VAAYFGKRHGHVLRDIRELHCSNEFSQPNFREFKIKDLAGESTSHVMITKDGFAFLAMGFTGAKAAAFKEKYIE
jgi:Rha family phage regulatory protein